MSAKVEKKGINDLVFGLDIGTRNIVGVVGFLEHNRFKVVAMAEEEHETRAMLDGQIHDIYKVGDTIRKVKNELEKQLEITLSDVCIAAAGRVLKTINASATCEFEEETRINQEHIYSLNLLAVENAHNEINDGKSDVRFYCVGNSPIRYQLNGYDINNLEGHKANKISVELIATFLPEEVVDGLYEAVEYAGLKVANLTLEPIAAMNIAIPENYRLLNIGLVDVGAGTSDICLTKDGCIIAYGMIPLAGDELTENIAKHFLVDFNTAEVMKVEASKKKTGFVTFDDIMGISQKVKASDVRAVVTDAIDNMAKEVADKIKELNGGKSANAVFVVGGGGKMPGYTDKVAEYLGIANERVAVRGEEVLKTVDFEVNNFTKDSLYVTPVGICTNYYTQKNNFVFVNVNNERVKLYDNNKLTVVDAILQIGYPNEKLFPRRGKEINFTVNGKTRLVRGSAGEGAVVTLNGKAANLNTKIEQNDIIVVKESTVGEVASITIGQLEEFESTISFNVDDKNVICPRFAYVNGELKSEFYDICDGDKIRMENFYTVAQLFEFLDLNYKDYEITVNNEIADKNTKVYENFTVKTISLAEKASRVDFKDLEEVDVTTDEEYLRTKALSEEKVKEINEQKLKEEKQVVLDDNGEEIKPINSINDEPRADVDGSDNTQSVDIMITVNQTPIKLTGKSSYVLVDLFQFYSFDLTIPRGNLVFKHNGEEADYSKTLNSGDEIVLYWEGN